MTYWKIWNSSIQPKQVATEPFRAIRSDCIDSPDASDAYFLKFKEVNSWNFHAVLWKLARSFVREFLHFWRYDSAHYNELEWAFYKAQKLCPRSLPGYFSRDFTIAGWGDVDQFLALNFAKMTILAHQKVEFEQLARCVRRWAQSLSIPLGSNLRVDLLEISHVFLLKFRRLDKSFFENGQSVVTSILLFWSCDKGWGRIGNIYLR